MPTVFLLFTSTAMTDDDAIGCYVDSSIDRVFSDRLVDKSGMSPEVRIQFFVVCPDCWKNSESYRLLW